MSIILIASAIIRVCIFVLVAFKLVWRYRHLGQMEHLGLALIGGPSLLTTAPILMGKGTPYDDWAGLVFGIGMIMYLSGKLVREWRYQ